MQLCGHQKEQRTTTKFPEPTRNNRTPVSNLIHGDNLKGEKAILRILSALCFSKVTYLHQNCILCSCRLLKEGQTMTLFRITMNGWHDI